MAELEAITVIVPTEKDLLKNAAAETRQYGRRFPLPLDKPLRLGRESTKSDLAVPEDGMISGHQATVVWDGTKLSVVERAEPPTDLPKNPITVKSVPAPKCDILPGQSFKVGQTRFTVYQDGEGLPVNPLDATHAPRAVIPTRADLDRVPFANPNNLLAAVSRLSSVFRTSPTEKAQVSHMLRVVVTALPRADAAGLVFVPPDSSPAQLKLGVRDYTARLAGGASMARSGENQKFQFAPSRRLVHQAVREKKSVVHYWTADSSASATGSPDVTMPPPGQQFGGTPWAICTPLQDGSQSALYVTGHLAPGESPSAPAVADDLAGYSKVAELMAGLLEVTRQTHRLRQQNALLSDFVPKRVRPYFADPDRTAEVLEPREVDVTVLFCDLRNFSRFIEKEGVTTLAGAWTQVAHALNVMSTAVTLHDGVVCRVLGDAVMGFWGWPGKRDADADVVQAARAAAHIRSGIEWMRQHRCGVGVAFGRALVGKLGALDLAEIDVYGSVVNLASRLETMTKAFGVSVIVTEEVAARLAKRDDAGGSLRTRRLGTVRPKGMLNTFTVYELMPQENAYMSGQLAFWNEAVDWFTEGRWADAYQQLEENYHDDPAAACLMREMDRYNRQPPAGWDGAFTPRPPDEESPKA